VSGFRDIFSAERRAPVRHAEMHLHSKVFFRVGCKQPHAARPAVRHAMQMDIRLWGGYRGQLFIGQGGGNSVATEKRIVQAIEGQSEWVLPFAMR